jgi:hypothetical protein
MARNERQAGTDAGQRCARGVQRLSCEQRRRSGTANAPSQACVAGDMLLGRSALPPGPLSSSVPGIRSGRLSAGLAKAEYKFKLCERELLKTRAEGLGEARRTGRVERYRVIEIRQNSGCAWQHNPRQNVPFARMHVLSPAFAPGFDTAIRKI